MPVSDPAQLKTYFETGDKPTEAEFAELIDSQYNKVVGLGTKVTFLENHTIMVPAEMEIVSLHIWSPFAQTIKIGDTVGSGEYMDDAVGVNTIFTLNLGLMWLVNKNLFISGFGTMHVKYYIK